DGQLIWILDSVPVGSTGLLFTATGPASNHADQVEMAVAENYEDGNGGAVRVETKPSSISVLPVPAAPPVWPLQLGVILAVLAFVGRSLFLPPGPHRFRADQGLGRGRDLPAPPERGPPEALLSRSRSGDGFRHPRRHARRGADVH